MLKLVMRICYQGGSYTDETELFNKLYKWRFGLFTLLELRRILGLIIFGVIGIIWIIFIKPRIYGLGFIVVGEILFILELKERLLRKQLNSCEPRTPARIRTLRMEHFIRKIITTNGKALGRREWKAIKEQDIGLYTDLLCDKCDHQCNFYSLEIAKIIKDSTLIWGAIEEPMEDGHNYYAHAVILRNGYIYDSNMRQSERYQDFIKLYKFKLYKQWNYEQYSREDFGRSESTEFRKWCKENNVSGYREF